MIALLFATAFLLAIAALFMLQTRWTKPWPVMLSAAAAIPLLAVSLYLVFASLPIPAPQMAAPPTGQGREFTEAEILKMTAMLEEHLKLDPAEIDGWTKLARAHLALGRFDAAAEDYAHLVRLAPADASFLADFADTLAMARNRSLLGEPEKLIARALEADPQNIKALALSGSAAFERREYQTAVVQWKKILMLVPPESENAKSSLSSIGEAQSLAEGLPTVSAPAATSPVPGLPAGGGNRMQ
ncbi:hypothetical protein BH11PSE11_BH11PSE11_39400 [soil metagenome]